MDSDPNQPSPQMQCHEYHKLSHHSTDNIGDDVFPARIAPRPEDLVLVENLLHHPNGHGNGPGNQRQSDIIPTGSSGKTKAIVLAQPIIRPRG